MSRISFANILCSKWCRTDGDARISSYSYKPCYREVQSQAGFSGDGHITYGKDSGIDRRRTFVDHLRGKLSLSIYRYSHEARDCCGLFLTRFVF